VAARPVAEPSDFDSAAHVGGASLSLSPACVKSTKPKRSEECRTSSNREIHPEIRVSLGAHQECVGPPSKVLGGKRPFGWNVVREGDTAKLVPN
jgi:hypothetical protein